MDDKNNHIQLNKKENRKFVGGLTKWRGMPLN